MKIMNKLVVSTKKKEVDVNNKSESSLVDHTVKTGVVVEIGLVDQRVLRTWKIFYDSTFAVESIEISQKLEDSKFKGKCSYQRLPAVSVLHRRQIRGR